MNLLRKLPPFDPESKALNVVIDTPKGCRNKFAYDKKRKAYLLKAVLPHGAVFPFDFGSIAGTIAEDGDPLDALVLMDEPAFVGCLVESRVIGVLEANQTENGKTERNDRLIAVAVESHTRKEIKSLDDVDRTLLQEIEHFFFSYNQERGRKFETIGCRGPKRACSLVQKHTGKTKRGRKAKSK
jgi:inorganic pyrophosphatase